jgi:Flp pilus assembly pilin Flp
LAQRPQAERGQALMEYELVIVLVAIIVILVLVVLGQNIRDTYQFIIDSLPI